jgi:hypothetical protein
MLTGITVNKSQKKNSGFPISVKLGLRSGSGYASKWEV